MGPPSFDLESTTTTRSKSRGVSFGSLLKVAFVLLVLAFILFYIFSRQASHDHTVVLRSRQGTEVHILTLGAVVQRLVVPDKHGNLGDVVLGFDDFLPYKDGTSPYFGAVVGRVANRIAAGKFNLDRKLYNLSINDPPNSLHGGQKGWSRTSWKLLRKGTIPNGGKLVRLGLHSPSGDEGFPGSVHATVTYTLTEASTLTMIFEATAESPTPINMAQHCYFNLDGVESPKTIEDHILQINSSYVTPVDSVRIPTGKFEAVARTAFDFSQPTAIGKRLSKVPGPEPGGYDINYVLWGRNQEEALAHTRYCRALHRPDVAATLKSSKTGRKLEVLTDSPGLQFYSGNQLDGIVGKAGVPYIQYGGLALETQMFPDFVNQPTFPKCILRPGERYRTTAVWRFSVQE